MTTSTQLRIDLSIHREIKLEATRRGISVQKWLSDLARRELGLKQDTFPTVHNPSSR